MRKMARAIAVASVVSIGLSSLFISPSQAAQKSQVTVPSPAIVSVLPGATSTTLVVTYSPVPVVEVDPATAAGENIYEVSLDNQTWWPCAEPTAEEIAATQATCNLVSLQASRSYGVYLRTSLQQEFLPGSYTVVDSSVATGPVVGTTQLSSGTDPDKPTKLPSPRAWVGAKFNAASNSLGVDGTKVALGVGTLPKIIFSRDIPDKAVVENHLYVSAQLPNGKVRAVPGAWGWVSERSAVFRPKDYWPGRSIIRIVSTLDRAVLGKSGKTWLIGSKKLNTTFQFRTARKLVAKVDGRTTQMKVFIDGEKVKTFKVSLGKNEWETRNGTKVISTAKEEDKTYLSESLGLTDPEDQYELDAKWNTRLTPTGEFIHSAPWAYSRIGRYNGSHGCTNMFQQDAEWIFNKTIPGDVVLYTNTGGEIVEPWNGPGGLWNIPWSKWIKKSALGSGTGVVDTDTNAGTGSLADAKPASA